MDKEEALAEFLKGLRVALNNASAYSKDHPYFLRSVEEFKKKLDTLFAFLDPVKINIAEDSLFIDGRRWEKLALYTELASLFHLRKIKSLELSSGSTVGELADFLSGLALPPREIIKSGGFGVILAKALSSHCKAEELDYSSLLQGSGQETGDVWAYIFGEALVRQDPAKLKEFADNFELFLRKIKTQELFDNGELQKNLHNFLAYLKENQKEEYRRCAKALLEEAVKFRDKVSEEQLDKIKAFFSDLDEKELAELLWDKFLKDDSFDLLSYQLFSRLSGEGRHSKISESLRKKSEGDSSLRSSPRAFKKIQELLLASDSGAISEGYRNILFSLSKSTSFSQELTFDRKLLRINYRYLLLNLLEKEARREKLELIIRRVSLEWKNAEEDGDLRFARYLAEVISEKAAAGIGGISDGLNPLILDFSLRMLFEKGLSEDVQYLLEHLDKSSLSLGQFAEKVCGGDQIHREGLKALIRFFPDGLERLCEMAKIKREDIEFLSNLIASLKECDPAPAKEALMRIFVFSNEFVRAQALSAMADLGGSAPEFIRSIIPKASPLIRKEAVLALKKSGQFRQEIAALLLDIPSAFGRNNKMLMENLNIADEAELREAEEEVERLSRRPFFWNRQVRIRARQLLAKWHAGKS